MTPHVLLLSTAVGAVGTLAGAVVGVFADVAPGSDANIVAVTAIVVALVGAIPGSLLAFAALRAANRSEAASMRAEAHAAESNATSKATGEAVDGVVTKLMKSKDETLIASVGQAHAEGELAGAQAQRDRATAPTQ